MQEDTEVRPASPERFTPGTLIADRFRIIAAHGSGGMGEVYRADDVKLGQAVALKFLPARLAGDPLRLQRLYAEVRIGRQVSHPNVCRLYDIMEWQGSHFIAMEYIDGEDLRSLLRRIGKLPHEKALELAHEICAGLAAAHALGIVHRDLKPANIMIDGRGHARVTDFGLAALESDLAGQREIAGTPAYMAPEQSRGGTITQRTDLYSLGLIFSEMFPADPDPAVQRVIQRCLEKEPEARPSSIHAIIAALPGGDPLQAALDAGETPSPEMVAAAGETGELRAGIAIALLAMTLLFIIAAAMLNEKSDFIGAVEPPKRPESLADRARDLAAAFGYSAAPADTFSGFSADREYFGWTTRAEYAAMVQPSPLSFVYRESPRKMIAFDSERRVTWFDPPFDVPGMIRVNLQPDGFLRTFEAVPPQHQPPGPSPAVDWTPLLAATGIDMASLRSVAPEWRAPGDTDRKVAWTGTFPGQPALPMRIEAASYSGRPVWLRTIPPWRRPAVAAAALAPLLPKLGQTVLIIVFFIVCAVVPFLAWRNVRRRRADRAGAARIALVSFFVSFAAFFLRFEHFPDPTTEWNETFMPALWPSCAFMVISWVTYLAIEPYLRRRWPRTLIGWSRLLAGNRGDPMVGRDLLIGVLAGAGLSTAGAAMRWITGDFDLNSIVGLANVRQVGSTTLNNVFVGALMAIALGVILLLAHATVRNRTAAVVITGLIWAAGIPTSGANAGLEIAFRLLSAAVLMGIYVRFGILAAALCLCVERTLNLPPLTLDPSLWYFGRSLAILALVAAIAVYGFYRSLGTRALFARAVLDD